MTEPLEVVVENVTKRFGTRTVLDGLSLSIGAHQTVALIGPSGGGKSTLLRCINGLNTFDAGQSASGRTCCTPATTARTRANPSASAGWLG